MFIKITKTHHRALDPRTVQTFSINEVCEFEDNIAQNIIANGFAVEFKELKQEIENKAILEIPETKEVAEEAKEELEKASEPLEEEAKEELEEFLKEKPVAKQTTAKKKK